MRKILATITIFGIMLMLIPAISLFTSRNDKKSEESESSSQSQSEERKEPEESENIPPEDVTYKVLDITTDEVFEISVRDYMIGAVAAEMPSSFQEEALKAQAVAAHTYAERRRVLFGESEELKGAYFSNDSTKFQAFWTESQMKAYFGDDYESKYGRIAKCVDDVLDVLLMSEGEPIIAAFHSMSSGMTESAANVWGGNVSYLIPVESTADKTAPKYQQDYTFSIGELKTIFENYDSEISLPDNPEKIEDWFDITQKSASNTIVKIKVGGKELKGSDIRTLLKLRSSAFDIYLTDGVFTITTYGYGHGVGMSQYGANALALDGKTYTEILQHYYPGAELVSTAPSSVSTLPNPVSTVPSSVSTLPTTSSTPDTSTETADSTTNSTDISTL
jgi:stage II sporulation protein D